MTIDERGIDLITSHEGLRLKAYQDSGGVWTIGYGHTATAKSGMTITKDQARTLFKRDVNRFEQCVNETITQPLTQEQFNALVSFAYNRGCNGFKKSQIVEYVNAGDYTAATKVWPTVAVTAGGKRLAGLVKRRTNEAAMFAQGFTASSRNLAVNRVKMVFGQSLKYLFGKA